MAPSNPKGKLQWLYGELDRAVSKPLNGETLPLRTSVWSRELHQLVDVQLKGRPYHRTADLDRLRSTMSRFDRQVQDRADSLPQDQTSRDLLLNVWRGELGRQKAMLHDIITNGKY